MQCRLTRIEFDSGVVKTGDHAPDFTHCGGPNNPKLLDQTLLDCASKSKKGTMPRVKRCGGSLLPISARGLAVDEFQQLIDDHPFNDLSELLLSLSAPAGALGLLYRDHPGVSYHLVILPENVRLISWTLRSSAGESGATRFCASRTRSSSRV